jgi:hypothetical protein
MQVFGKGLEKHGQRSIVAGGCQEWERNLAASGWMGESIPCGRRNVAYYDFQMVFKYVLY